MVKKYGKCLETRIYLGNQTWHLDSYWEVKGRKLHVHIARNAYNHQSSANVKIFSPTDLTWSGLSFIPYAQMASIKNEATAGRETIPEISYIRNTVSPRGQQLMHADETELLRLASLILGNLG